MTLGLGLLYVGCVLFMNGIATMTHIPGKAAAVMNFFTGGFLLIINTINIAYVVLSGGDATAFYGIATNMLFGFTYLFVGCTDLWDLDGRPLGWYCFFVALTAIPCAIISLQGGDVVFFVIWLVWAILWFLFWVANVPEKAHLNEKGFGFFISAVGVLTCWVPGFMMLAGWWCF